MLFQQPVVGYLNGVKRMRVLFMGSGPLACPSLRIVAETPSIELAAVVTQPERPSGRRLQPAPCPVMALARSLGSRILAPEQVASPEWVSELAALNPDVIVVADYGQILPPALLALPPLGAVNVHPSRLPRYRGAAPVQWAIARGERETGVTIIYMNERMDAGDVILAETVPIADDDTAVTLSARLAELGAKLLIQALHLIGVGTAPRHPQDEAQATYARKLKKEDGWITWSLPAIEIRNRIRGFQPWPGAFFRWPRRGLLVHVHAAVVEQGGGEPGTVIAIDGNGPVVACGQDALRLVSVQPEGRRAMEGAAFCAGYHPAPGESFRFSDADAWGSSSGKK